MTQMIDTGSAICSTSFQLHTKSEEKNNFLSIFSSQNQINHNRSDSPCPPSRHFFSHLEAHNPVCLVQHGNRSELYYKLFLDRHFFGRIPITNEDKSCSLSVATHTQSCRRAICENWHWVLIKSFFFSCRPALDTFVGWTSSMISVFQLMPNLTRTFLFAKPREKFSTFFDNVFGQVRICYFLCF